MGWRGVTVGQHRGEDEQAGGMEKTGASENKSKLLLLHSVGQSGCF